MLTPRLHSCYDTIGSEKVCLRVPRPSGRLWAAGGGMDRAAQASSQNPPGRYITLWQIKGASMKALHREG